MKEEISLSAHLKRIQSMGGKALLAKYGPDHFKKLRALPRKKKDDATSN